MKATLKILGSGTSTGVPIVRCSCPVCTSDDPRNKRFRTSAAVILDSGETIIIDTGPEFRMQALAAGLSRVDAVLYTHKHADHIMGMDDLRVFTFDRKEPIPCYGNPATIERLKSIYDWIFSPDPAWQGGRVADLEAIAVDNFQKIELYGSQAIPIPLVHGNAQMSGYRIGEIGYAPDCKEIPPESMKALSGVRYMILDGTRFEPHRTHLTIPEAVELAGEIGAEKTYLIHFSHDIDHEIVSADMPEGVELAYDGLEIPFEA